METRSILDLAEQAEYVPIGKLQVEFDQLQKWDACILPADTTKPAPFCKRHFTALPASHDAA